MRFAQDTLKMFEFKNKIFNLISLHKFKLFFPFCIKSSISSSYLRLLVSRVAQSVQCLATGWTTGRSRFDRRKRRKDFPLASVSRLALGPTQPPVQWVPGVISSGLKRGRGVTLTTLPHLLACNGTALAFIRLC
jgi:hypothetical protein